MPDSSQKPRELQRSAFGLLFVSLLAIGAGNTMLISAVIPPLTRELGLSDWMGGAIFSIGLIRFSQTRPRLWMAIEVAGTELGNVAAMGY